MSLQSTAKLLYFMFFKLFKVITLISLTVHTHEKNALMLNSIKIWLVCLFVVLMFVCLFVSNKRQNG